MKKLLTVALASGLLSLVACAQNSVKGDGNLKTESRNISGFTGVSAAGSMDVEVSTGSGHNVEIMADANLLPYIETTVKNGVLRIAQKNNYNLRATKGIKVRVQMPQVASVSVSGSGNVMSSGVLKVENDFSVSVAGSGTCKINVSDNANVKASIAGSGDIMMRGATAKLGVSIAGSGNFKGYELEAQTADLRISGSGDIQTNVTNSLSASVAGSGNVKYKGSPATSFKASGSGNISKAN